MSAVLGRRQVLSGLFAAACGVGGWRALAPRVLGREAPGEGELRGWVERLAEARLLPWEGGPKDELMALRAMNPEYDLMARTFTAMGLADLALMAPARWKERAIRALDAMIADTDGQIEARGQDAFLLPYGHGWDQPSLFVDGERLLVMTIRRLLQEQETLAERSQALGAAIAERMASTPSCSWPSYPDECWAFCNTLALVALRALQILDGTSHEALTRAHVAALRRSLTDPGTGMILSAWTVAGRRREDPEGSSIWATSHFLRAVDPAYADEQYALAREQLGRVWLGFGFGREWVEDGLMDVDSGPIVPIVGASPSSSGLAILAAQGAGDRAFSRALYASLGLFALPRDEGGLRTYRAGNAVGDAVIFAASTTGPLWRVLGSGIAPGLARSVRTEGP